MTDETGSTEPAPSWFIEEGRPGPGDRPAWLGEKFRTVADLGKSYAELEKKFSTAPEEYDLGKSRYIDPDYAPFQDLAALAREKRVPKEVMDKMVDSFDRYMNEFSTDMGEERKKLGEKADERIAVLDNWAKANLAPESYEALAGSLRTAASIKALEEIRNRMMGSSTMVPGSNDSSSGSAPTIADVQDEISQNLAKYKTDAKYRAEVQSRLEMAAKAGSGMIDKTGP